MNRHPSNLGSEAEAKVRIPMKEFAAKFQTKKEVYDFLTVCCKAYEPPQDTVTIWHLRDQANGTKDWVRGDSIKHLSVPFYEDLSIKKILEWAQVHCPTVLDRYFPIERETLRMPRQVSWRPLALPPRSRTDQAQSSRD
jgi:hypothetical protein